MKLELSQQNIAQIEKETSTPAISIYLPLENTLSDRKKNRITFENLLKNAARKIIKSGSDKSYARQFVEPGFKLAQDHFFWKAKASGLAIFIAAPQILRYFELPLAPKESMYAGEGFDVARIKKIFEASRDFYLLVASKNNLDLYRNKNECFKKLSVANLPKNIKEITSGKNHNKKLQSHSGAPAGKSELFHGQGQGKETEKIAILKYFQTADSALRAILANKTEPLIFAGSPNLFPIFRKANSYPRLLKIALKGNFDDTPPSELFEKASNLLKNAAQ